MTEVKAHLRSSCWILLSSASRFCVSNCFSRFASNLFFFASSIRRLSSLEQPSIRTHTVSHAVVSSS